MRLLGGYHSEQSSLSEVQRSLDQQQRSDSAVATISLALSAAYTAATGAFLPAQRTGYHRPPPTDTQPGHSGVTRRPLPYHVNFFALFLLFLFPYSNKSNFKPCERRLHTFNHLPLSVVNTSVVNGCKLSKIFFFIHGFCLVVHVSMRTRTIFHLLSTAVIV